MTVRGVAMTKRPAAPPAAAPKQRFKAEIDSAMKKWHDKAAAEPKHEAPGCAYCMGGGVKPGCVCPKCGDRLPTMEPKDEQVERLIADLREPYTQPNVCEQAADALVAIAAERDQLRDALDMATQGKYSALMLELADGRAEQIHAGIQACVLRGDVEMLTAERDRAVEALRELVACNDLQGRINISAMAGVSMSSLANECGEWDQRMPKAMIAARAALAASLQPQDSDHQPLDSEAKRDV